MKRLVLTFALLPLALGACGTNVKKSLGLERNQPDEFAVMNRAPLTVPPNFNLSPPTPGVQSPQEALAASNAQDLVLGNQSTAPVDPTNSAGQAALLSKAGATGDNSAVRRQLATPDTDTDKETVSQKMGLSSASAKGKTLDPTSEAARLQKQNIKTPVSPVMLNAR